MTDERSDDTSSFTQGLDSRSLIQLLQNNNEITERYYTRRKKWISPLGVSVVILYGIVAIMLLQLTISSALRQTQNDNSEPQKETFIRMGYDVKKLQDDVTYLKMQNKDLLTKLYLLMNANRNESIINNEKYFESQELLANEINFELSGWNESALVERINNVTQKFENQFILVQNQLNTKEQKIEQRLFDRLSEKVIEEISKKTMNQSIQELLIKGSNDSSSSIEQDFITFQELIFKTFGGSEKVSKVILKAIKNNEMKKIRSCGDYKRLGITENGFYDINLGNPSSNFSSARVYCNFTSNSAYLYHNGIEGANITACEGDACFQYNLTYSASLDQIKVLIGNSRHCQQSIRFRCYHASLKSYGAWYDSSGEKQSYFTGSNYGKHLCQCYNSPDGCSGLPSINKCNCDAGTLPVWLEDMGNITNKTALPISRFTYGHLYTGGGQKAFIQVGPLNCTEEVEEMNHLSDGDESRIMAKWHGSYMTTNGMSYNNGYLRIKTAGIYLAFCEINSHDNYSRHYSYFCRDFGSKKYKLKFYDSGHQLELSYFDNHHSFKIYLLMAK